MRSSAEERNDLKDVEIYGQFIEAFIDSMTGSDAGQFRLEIPTFRIILERSRVQKSQLIKFTLTDNGKVINKMDDDDESLSAMNLFLQKVMDFISSLIGEELARDVIRKNLEGQIKEFAALMKGRDRLLAYIPEPIEDLIRNVKAEDSSSGNHFRVLEQFNNVFSQYLADLSKHTDLSALKLKLSILREKNELLKHTQLLGNQTLEFDPEVWSQASDEDVGASLTAVFDSIVGLSIFMMGKEEAIRKGAFLFQDNFQNEDDLLERYGLMDTILDGALHKNLSTGFPPLDRKLQGGLQKGSSILLISPSGIERDNFILNLFTTGLERDGSLLYVTSKEPPRSIRMLLKTRDLKPEDLEESGNLRIVDWFSWRGDRIIGVEKDGYALKSSKILSNLGIAINKSMRELDYSTNRMALIHFIGPAINIFDFQQVYNFIQRLRAKFKESDMCAIFLLETESLGKEELPRLMEIFDGTIEISKNMRDRKLEREIGIVSMDGIDFDATPIRFMIKENRLVPIHDGDPDEGRGGSIKKSHGVRKLKRAVKADKAGTSEKTLPVKKPRDDIKKATRPERINLKKDDVVIQLGGPAPAADKKDKTGNVPDNNTVMKPVHKRKYARQKKKPVVRGEAEYIRPNSPVEKKPTSEDQIPDCKEIPQKTPTIPKKMVRRRSKPDRKGIGSKGIETWKESELGEAPDILLKDAVSTIERILEESNSSLKNGDKKPIKVKRKI